MGSRSSLGRTCTIFSNNEKTPTAGRYLWIDAICINQENISERNHQVHQMSHIHESSEFAVVWLGRGDRDREMAQARDPNS